MNAASILAMCVGCYACGVSQRNAQSTVMAYYDGSVAKNDEPAYGEKGTSVHCPTMLPVLANQVGPPSCPRSSPLQSDMSTSDSHSISSSESESSSSSTEQSDTTVSQVDHEQLTSNHHDPSINDPYVHATLQWTLDVPIGLGLCPWAVKSHNMGRLRIVHCNGDMRSDVCSILTDEITWLTSCKEEMETRLRTTLVICPHVKEWNDVSIFEEFVKHSQISLDQVTLVAFHPSFQKWYGLPPNFGIESIIHSHWGTIGQKSEQTAQATIIEVKNRVFGLRKIKIRFHDEMDGRRQEQYVPVDWTDTIHTNLPRDGVCSPLPDNFMYQSPYPTIHIIHNQDLSQLCVRDVSRVKRLNAKRMARLGWEGLKERFEKKGRENVEYESMTTVRFCPTVKNSLR